MPVDPLLQIPCRWGETMSGNSGTSDVAVASSHSLSFSARYSRGSITSRSRWSSQSGRSHRTGTGTAPSFQAANTLSVNRGEFRNPMPRRSPKPTPRSLKAPASWLDLVCNQLPGERVLLAFEPDVPVRRLIRPCFGQDVRDAERKAYRRLSHGCRHSRLEIDRL